jgi:hypothetical protein
VPVFDPQTLVGPLKGVFTAQAAALSLDFARAA